MLKAHHRRGDRDAALALDRHPIRAHPPPLAARLDLARQDWPDAGHKPFGEFFFWQKPKQSFRGTETAAPVRVDAPVMDIALVERIGEGGWRDFFLQYVKCVTLLCEKEGHRSSARSKPGRR